MNYTISLDTAKKLHEMGCNLDFVLPEEKIYQWEDEEGEIIAFPKYDLRDIICDGEMAKKFFGEGGAKCSCGVEEGKNHIVGCESLIFAINIHGMYILQLLQQNKKEEAEKYLLTHTILRINNMTTRELQ
jgi:hypothetical protein